MLCNAFAHSLTTQLWYTKWPALTATFAALWAVQVHVHSICTSKGPCDKNEHPISVQTKSSQGTIPQLGPAKALAIPIWAKCSSNLQPPLSLTTHMIQCGIRHMWCLCKYRDCIFYALPIPVDPLCHGGLCLAQESGGFKVRAFVSVVNPGIQDERQSRHGQTAVFAHSVFSCGHEAGIFRSHPHDNRPHQMFCFEKQHGENMAYRSAETLLRGSNLCSTMSAICHIHIYFICSSTAFYCIAVTIVLYRIRLNSMLFYHIASYCMCYLCLTLLYATPENIQFERGPIKVPSISVSYVDHHIV